MTIDWSKLEIWKLSEEDSESLAEYQENPIESWLNLTHHDQQIYHLSD